MTKTVRFFPRVIFFSFHDIMLINSIIAIKLYFSCTNIRPKFSLSLSGIVSFVDIEGPILDFPNYLQWVCNEM